MPYRTINGKKVFVHPPSPEHPSGHGFTDELSNNAFVAGVKYEQAKERFKKNPSARTANAVEKAKMKYHKLQERKFKQK